MNTPNFISNGEDPCPLPPWPPIPKKNPYLLLSSVL